MLLQAVSLFALLCSRLCPAHLQLSAEPHQAIPDLPAALPALLSIADWGPLLNPIADKLWALVQFLTSPPGGPKNSFSSESEEGTTFGRSENGDAGGKMGGEIVSVLQRTLVALRRGAPRAAVRSLVAVEGVLSEGGEARGEEEGQEEGEKCGDKSERGAGMAREREEGRGMDVGHTVFPQRGEVERESKPVDERSRAPQPLPPPQPQPEHQPQPTHQPQPSSPPPPPAAPAEEIDVLAEFDDLDELLA